MVVHLPFLLEYKKILRQLLVLNILAVWIRYPWLLLLSFEMLVTLAPWILHKIQNHFSQYHLGVQLDLCIFGALPPTHHFSDDICPSMMHNDLLRPTSLLPRSPLSCFWLVSGSTPQFSPIFPFLVHCCLRCWIFLAWGIGINLWTKLWCCNELFPSPAIWSSWWFGSDSPIRILVDSLASRIHASFVWILLDAPTPAILHNFSA